MKAENDPITSTAAESGDRRPAPDFGAAARAAIDAVLPVVEENGGEHPCVGSDGYDDFQDAAAAALRPILGEATIADAWMLHKLVRAFADANIRDEGPRCNAALAVRFLIEDFAFNATATDTRDVLARAAFAREEVRDISDDILANLFGRILDDVDILIGKGSRGFEPRANNYSPVWNSYFHAWCPRKRSDHTTF